MPTKKRAKKSTSAKTRAKASAKTSAKKRAKTNAKTGKARAIKAGARVSKAKGTTLTQPTGTNVEEYFARISDLAKRAEVEQVHALIRRVAPALLPRVWGQFIGYGSYSYKYSSGREGEWFVIGLGGLMKTGISVYACATSPEGGYVAEKHRAALKPANVGRSCIRFKTLTKMDLGVLENVLKEAAAAPSFAM